MELVRQKTYRKTFEIACNQLAGRNMEERLSKAGLDFRKEGEAYHFSVPFFNETIEVVAPAFIFISSRASNINLAMKIVILHYVLNASGQQTGGSLIQYEDIPGCRSYLPVFERRVVKPLLKAFGYGRDVFIEAGKALGGKEEEYGNASFTLRALPRVPITFILWEGDQDFPPSLKVLFDQSVHTYLPLEDITVVSKMAATRIIKQARKEYIEQ
ncbi:MAG: hypothetical protein A4E57_03682 [Syntrophorhabdaceae bacterium PtaU1.Bin034]|nr:MAG: hypothetical protein A4E57_03682 [Syntrophorhabdaceae bacterium PtaU1.Bin034]